jgi:hypothetical protein
MITAKTRAYANLTKISAPTEPVAPEGLRMAIQLLSPVQDSLKGFVETNRQTPGLKVISQDSHLGQTVAICGAGPSLAKHVIEGVDQVWACNSALPFLYERGYTNLTGVGIDQTEGLQREWGDPPPVPYMLASSVDPALVRHLLDKGRDITFFHNAVGFDAELDFYSETWPPTLMVGQGYMVTSRMIGVAMWMGFKRVDIYGCDCALGDDDVAHANGEHVNDAYRNPLIMQGTISGREWKTRPDMLIGAIDLVRRVRKSEGRIRLVGDTLPVALIGEPDDFLDQVARVIKPGELNPEQESNGKQD